MTLLFAVEETNIHMRWDLQNQIWRKEKVTVSFEIEDFALNIKTTSVLMELLQQVGVGNVSFNLDTPSFLFLLLHIPYTIYFDEPSFLTKLYSHDFTEQFWNFYVVRGHYHTTVNSYILTYRSWQQPTPSLW